MASKTTLHNELRNSYIAKVSEYLASVGEEILVTGSNEIALPVVDSEGNEEYLVLTFKVPTGSRDGDPYDGYFEAEAYKAKVEQNEAKAKERAEKKAAKIARDKAERERKRAEKEAKA